MYAFLTFSTLPCLDLPPGQLNGSQISAFRTLVVPDNHRLGVLRIPTLVCFHEASMIGRAYLNFFIKRFTSSGLMRSGTVQPSRSYSAIHCSAKPLNFSVSPIAVEYARVSRRMPSWLPA